MTETERALIQIESALGIEPPLGALRMPPPTRYQAVLIELRIMICPKKDEIRALVESDKAELAKVIADTALSSLLMIPLPVATVASKVATIGLDRFCKQPAELLSE